MDYMTTKDAARKWDLTERMLQYYCKVGRILGTGKVGAIWLIPKDAKRSVDGRYKAIRQRMV